MLAFGGLVEYYGDVDAQEYQWKGPGSAVAIFTVCLAAVAAVQFSPLPGWMRGSGYVAVVALGSFMSLNASLSYHDAQCQDPDFEGSCGIPVLAAVGWGTVAVVCVTAMVVVAEAARHHRGRRLTT